ncbi:MAG TPA: flagellar filament capping protein FliD [Anaeromyxobacteraceae bacterium]|nr:flagellar filament capping protein FliD [Anaeromyxobacteraceae bacterium]
MSVTSSVAVSGLGTGLATQINTQSLISALVAADQQPITNLQSEQTATQTKISSLGSISSALAALQTAAGNLSQSGALGVTASSSNVAFSATPGSSAVAGSYEVEVDQLASAAKWRSGAFGSGDTVEAGTLTLTMNNKPYTVSVAAGSSLSDVANAIQASGAPVSAVVLNDGTYNYLSITPTATGYSGTSPSSALQVGFSKASGASGGLDPTATQNGVAPYSLAASNASFSIDGLQFTRPSNVVTDALPGTTLSLEQATGTPETLTLSNDASTTESNLQAFVTAYNSVMSLVQAQLNTTSSTDITTSLASDATVENLNSALQGLVNSTVPGLGSVQSLANLGLITQDDGSLSIDESALAAAIASDPSAVNAVFSTASTGIGDLTSALVTNYTQPGTGLIALDQSNLQSQVTQEGNQITALQAQESAYQDQLTQEFSAMESLVTNMTSIGNFLTQQANVIAAQANSNNG